MANSAVIKAMTKMEREQTEYEDWFISQNLRLSNLKDFGELKKERYGPYNDKFVFPQLTKEQVFGLSDGQRLLPPDKAASLAYVRKVKTSNLVPKVGSSISVYDLPYDDNAYNVCISVSRYMIQNDISTKLKYECYVASSLYRFCDIRGSKVFAEVKSIEIDDYGIINILISAGYANFLTLASDNGYDNQFMVF